MNNERLASLLSSAFPGQQCSNRPCHGPRYVSEIRTQDEMNGNENENENDPIPSAMGIMEKAKVEPFLRRSESSRVDQTPAGWSPPQLQLI